MSRRIFAPKGAMQVLQERLDEAGIPARVFGEPPAFQPWFADQEVVDFRFGKDEESVERRSRDHGTIR